MTDGDVQVRIRLFEELRRIAGENALNSERLAVHQAECAQRYQDIQRSIQGLFRWGRFGLILGLMLALSQFARVDLDHLLRLISIGL